MEEKNDITPCHECIQFLNNHSYIKNYSPHFLLEEFNYSIPLDKFICYCVGVRNDQRQTQCIQIITRKPSYKITTMLIRWFDPDNPLTGEFIQFWVNSGACLKKNIFLFEDKLNFLRSTFIYYEKQKQYFRLSSIINYIKLGNVNPIGTEIYLSPMKSFIFKRKNDFNFEKIKEKRKQILKRDLKYIVMRNNHDDIMHNLFPNLFHEIYKIVPRK